MDTFEHRSEYLARRARLRLEKHDNPFMREQVIDTMPSPIAKSAPIWLKIFCNDEGMMFRINERLALAE